MNIINLFSMFVGIVAFIFFLIEELTHKSIFYWINYYFYKLRFTIKKYIIDPLLHPNHVIWAMKHHLNYWHVNDFVLYNLDDVTWNEFLMMLKPEDRKRWNRKREKYKKDKALFDKCVLQPCRDLLLKGEKQNEN